MVKFLKMESSMNMGQNIHGASNQSISSSSIKLITIFTLSLKKTKDFISENMVLQAVGWSLAEHHRGHIHLEVSVELSGCYLL